MELCHTQKKSCGALMWDPSCGPSLSEVFVVLGIRGMGLSLIVFSPTHATLDMSPDLSGLLMLFLILSKITTYVTYYNIVLMLLLMFSVMIK